MAVKSDDRVAETTTTSGTGTLNLDGAKAGFQAVGDSTTINSGDSVYYTLEDGNNSEVGIGTFTNATPDTLSRDTVLLSIEGGVVGASKITLSGSAATVFATAPAAKLLIADENGIVVNPSHPAFNAELTSQQANVTGDGTAYDVTGAIWTEIADQNADFSNGTYTAPVAGPHRFTFMPQLSGLTSSHTTLLLALVTSNRTYTLFRANGANLRSGLFNDFFGAFSKQADMDLGDTAVVRITVSGGTKVVDLEGPTDTYFDGELIA